MLCEPAFVKKLPDVLSESDLSIAELHAAKLDGVLLPIGAAFRGIDRPDRRADRLAALAPTVPARVVVSEESAAWIWGAIESAPEPLRLSASIRQRARLQLSSRVVVREVTFTADDVVHLDVETGLQRPASSSAPSPAVAVTSALRTAIDLARSANRASAATALRQMFTLGLAYPDDVKAVLLTYVRVAGRNAALAAVERARPNPRDGTPTR